jgi:Holliday junction resolvase RusA-like endonuclease
VIEGEPKPQPRPRAFRRGQFVGVYNPTNADAWKVRCAVTAHDACGKPFAKAVRVALWFMMPRPASHRKKNGALRSSAPAKHVQRPDVDNLAKAVMDALSGIAFKDDAQVVELIVGKQWAEEAHGCIVTVEEVNAV